MRSAALPDAHVGDSQLVENEAERSESQLVEDARWRRALPLIVLLYGLVAALPISDNSFLTHLATGRLIVNSAVPLADPYTFTARGEPWVVQSWGASALYGTVESLFGATGLRVMGGALGMILGWLVVAMCRRVERPLHQFLLAGFGLAVLGEFLNLRPQLLAFVLFALLGLWCDRLVGPISTSVMFAVWVNVHGSWPMGLLLIAGFIGSSLVRRQRGRATALVVMLCGAMVGTMVGAMASPYGLDLVTFPIHMLDRAAMLKLVIEWSPAGLDASSVTLMCLVVAALAFAWKRRCWSALIPCVAFVALTVTAVRHFPFAVLSMASCLSLWVPASENLSDSVRSAASTPSLNWRSWSISLAVVVMVVAVTPNYNLARYPTDVVDLLDRSGVFLHRDHRILSSDTTGNYLQWRFSTQARNFVDDRVEVDDPQAFQDDFDLIRGENWDAIKDRYHPDMVIWATDSPLTEVLEADASVSKVMVGESFTLWCVNDSALCPSSES